MLRQRPVAQGFGQLPVDPGLQRLQVPHQLLKCLSQGLWLRPIHVQSRLHTRSQQHQNPRLSGHGLRRAAQPDGDAQHDLARRRAQQIERVFHAPGSFQRTGIKGHPQGLGHLARLKRLAPPRHCYRSLQQSPIPLGAHQARSKLPQRPLRKGIMANLTPASKARCLGVFPCGEGATGEQVASATAGHGQQAARGTQIFSSSRSHSVNCRMIPF